MLAEFMAKGARVEGPSGYLTMRVEIYEKSASAHVSVIGGKTI